MAIQPNKLSYPNVKCHWKFKGTECSYSGEGSFCDKSFRNCLSFSNSPNFGGFPPFPPIGHNAINRSTSISILNKDVTKDYKKEEKPSIEKYYNKYEKPKRKLDI